LKEYEINAKYLIAACDVDVLYKKLLPKGSIPESVTQKLEKAELYSSSVTISVALNCPAESLGFGDEMIHLFNEETSRMEHSSGDPHKSFISVLAPTVRDKSLAPEGMGTLNIFVPAWMDYKGNWGSKLNEKGEYERNDDYKQIKEAFAQIIFERVEKHLCPNLREHIHFYEVATPITYYRYTHNKNGTMMGTRPGRKNMELKVATYKTPIKNIFIGGHWAELGGGVPIAVKAAFNSSLLVLKKENPLEYAKMVRYIRQTPKFN
jgi:prolycopene isomerase